MMSELETLFKQKGQKLEAQANYRLSLQEKGRVWFVEKGSMILFAVEKKGGAEGRRILLNTVEKGGLIFPMPSLQGDPYEIFAFSEQAVSLRELSLSGLNEQTLGESFAEKLNEWVDRFRALLTTDIEIDVDHWVEGQSSLALEKGEIFSINPIDQEGALWGDFEQEVLKILGPYEIKIPQARKSFPIISHQYFLALEKGSVSFRPTTSVVQDGTWEEGLNQFHTFLIRFLEKKQSKTSQEELRRFHEKETLQSEKLHDSLNEMAAILKDDMSEPVAKTSDPLFQACCLVGKELGVELILPERKPFQGSLQERLERIGHRSNMRVRPAHLKPRWWKSDSGPLLGFYGKEKYPVAIIQNQWGFYEIHDPIRKTVKSLNAKRASHLSSDVYSFYLCFSDDLHFGRKVLQFFSKRNRKDLGLLGLYGFAAAILSLFPPFAIAILFNNAIPNANIHMLIQLFAGLLVAALSSSLFVYFSSLILGRIGGLASAQLQSSLWDRLLKLPVNFFRRFDGGDLLTRVWIMDQLSPLFTSDVARVVLTGVFSLSYLIAMLVYSVKLTLLGVLLLALSMGVTILCFRYKVKMQEKVLELQGRINGALVQVLSGIAKLRVAGAENNAFSHWASLYAKSKNFEIKGQHAQGFVAAAMSAFPLLSFLAIFAAVIQMEEVGKLSTGDFLAYNAAFLTFSAAIFSLNKTLLQTAQYFPFVKRSKVILEEEQELLLKKAHPGKLTGEIRMDNISFGYGEDGPLVLKDVSIHVNPREMIGIVGPSGSGKSTLIRLILGFETPRSGAVYYNGKDLSHLNINAVRKQMGVVLQGGGIIAGTLYQNIVAGGRYTEGEVNRAISLSGFQRDLQYFPMGLHTVIPMNGETLSGGQKQRLLIARALLPRPKILLLDEATSALDNKSQSEIAHNIDGLDISRIVIAHRLSTIRNANRIYVIQEGKVTQMGSFEELSEQKGLFADMLKRQKL